MDEKNYALIDEDGIAVAEMKDGVLTLYRPAEEVLRLSFSALFKAQAQIRRQIHDVEFERVLEAAAKRPRDVQRNYGVARLSA